ncbi:MAG TPA: quinone-dependent dihydroorotate dehydrogenase [Lacisediminihabitans sp.]|uniref:quinone-dependent dihydroorotate dehydrogenase n=1 Tax=Lacisediminihabitans sp. TaxID=2787631 RepID=UPI002ED84926
MYRLLFSLVLSKFDPETAHHLAFDVIRLLPRLGLAPLERWFTRAKPSLAVHTLGLTFDSPFGIAAGFDKDGRAVEGLGALGFGHIEVGTITAIPQPGNERPRLFRLIPDRAVINRMGFNNRGAADAAPRLAREMAKPIRPVIGANIGKSRIVDVEKATEDYLITTRLLAPVSDYLAVNVSSPNTPGLRGLQELDLLRPLLTAVQGAAGKTPVLVKISPDLSDDEIRGIAGLVVELGIDGIVATNTTVAREGLGLITDPAIVERAGAGGLSGAPLGPRAIEVLRILRTVVPADLCIIASGGAETAQDVADRLAAGATLVQGYTGFLYRGPLWGRSINRGLAKLARGLTTLERVA